MKKQQCKQCGKEFTLSESELEYFKQKSLHIPKRCHECREANQSIAAYQQQHKNRSNGRPGSNNSKTNWIYLSLVVIIAIAAIVVPMLIHLTSMGIDFKTGEYKEPSYKISDDTAIDQNKAINSENKDDNKVTEKESAPKTAHVAVKKETKYLFKTVALRKEHFEKHGIEMGFTLEKEYETAAFKVINSPHALHKTEKTDGDDVYYIESTNDFVIVSTDGWIRTYFRPDEGKAYYDKQ